MIGTTSERPRPGDFLSQAAWAAKNRQLATLASPERRLSGCQIVELRCGHVPGEPSERMREPMLRVFFPIGSFITLITAIDGRMGLEIGLSATKAWWEARSRWA